MLKAPVPTEHQEQARLVKELRSARVNGRQILFCAVPNGVRTSVRQAVKLKREGLERHVPDLLIFTRSPKNGRPTAIEMKRVAGSAIAVGQVEYLVNLEAEGWNTAFCKGADKAHGYLKELGYLT